MSLAYSRNGKLTSEVGAYKGRVVGEEAGEEGKIQIMKGFMWNLDFILSRLRED